MTPQPDAGADAAVVRARTATARSPPPSCRSRSARRSTTTPARTAPSISPARTACSDLSMERPDDTVVALGPVALGDAVVRGDRSRAASSSSTPAAASTASTTRTTRALWLDGTASHDEMPAAGKTLIRYADPVARAALPARSTALAYSTTAALAGATIDGLPFIGTDQVDVDVTGRRAPRRAVRRVLAGAARAHARHAHAVDRHARRRQAHDALHVRMLRRGRTRREQAGRDRPPTSRPPPYLRRFALGVTP